jgi:hypothetical protein
LPDLESSPDELSCSPDDYETHDDYAHAMARIAAADRRDWAIGGEDPDVSTTETEYAIEAQPGACARMHTDDLGGLIDELVDFAAGARLITRTVVYGPWRYVTPEEIEAL